MRIREKIKYIFEKKTVILTVVLKNKNSAVYVKFQEISQVNKDTKEKKTVSLLKRQSYP